MEITCTRNALRGALGALSKLVVVNPKVTPWPPYRGQVLVRADHTGISMSGTDLEVWVTLGIAGRVIEAGEALVTARVLADFVKALKEDYPVTLKANDASGKEPRLNVNAQGHKTWMKLGLVEEFPSHPLPGADATWLKSQYLGFAYLALQAITAAAKEDSRPMLTGVSIAVKDNLLTVLGGDGYRVGLGQRVHESPDLGTIVPARSLSLALSMIDRNIAVAIEDQRVHLKTEHDLVSIQTMQGKYPDLTDVINQVGDLQLTLDRDEFAETVRTCRIFAKQTIDCLDIEVAPSGEENATLRIAGQAEEIGDNVATLTEIPCLNPRPIQLSINGKNLVDAVQALDQSLFHVEIASPTTPIVVRSASVNPLYKHVLMPLVRR